MVADENALALVDSLFRMDIIYKMRICGTDPYPKGEHSIAADNKILPL